MRMGRGKCKVGIQDLERVLFTAEDLAACTKRLGKEIDAAYAGEGIVAVGMLKGATLFFADLIRQIHLPVQIDFMSASSYGCSAQSSGEVKIKQDISADIQGKHVLLIEDIVDTGCTLYNLLPLLAQRGPKSLKLCALLDKPERRKFDVKIDFRGFMVPDEFLVGYGLDYAEAYRNLPCVGILKREIYA